MRLFLLGATGGTGQQVLRQALNRGHEVTTLARSPQKITRRDPKLTILSGDPLSVSELRAALPGHDAVISALGPHSPAPTTAASDCARALVRAMRGTEVKRLIVVSGALLFKHAGGLTPLFFLVRKVFSNVLRDHQEAEKQLAGSGLDWTIVRPPYLSSGVGQANYRALESRLPPRGLRLSRADLARFLLDVMENQTYSRKIVGVSQ